MLVECMQLGWMSVSPRGLHTRSLQKLGTCYLMGLKLSSCELDTRQVHTNMLYEYIT